MIICGRRSCEQRAAEGSAFCEAHRPAIARSDALAHSAPKIWARPVEAPLGCCTFADIKFKPVDVKPFEVEQAIARELRDKLSKEYAEIASAMGWIKPQPAKAPFVSVDDLNAAGYGYIDYGGPLGAKTPAALKMHWRDFANTHGPHGLVGDFARIVCQSCSVRWVPEGSSADIGRVEALPKASKAPRT